MCSINDVGIGIGPDERGAAAFRVEHRCGDAVAVLHDGADHRSCAGELDRLARELGSLGATGVLHLVDLTTGDVLDRRVLVVGWDAPFPPHWSGSNHATTVGAS